MKKEANKKPEDAIRPEPPKGPPSVGGGSTIMYERPFVREKLFGGFLNGQKRGVFYADDLHSALSKVYEHYSGEMRESDSLLVSAV